MKPLQTFQNRIGVSPDNQFGPKTLRAAAQELKLNAIEAAHFFGQCGHETAGFRYFEENLNYSAGGLLKVFGKYFDSEEKADYYERNPEAIASLVYANRMGNGDEMSGDGWKYRGRGAIQLTGRANYESFSDYLGVDVVENPDTVEDLYAFESALFFFQNNELFELCTEVSEYVIKKVTRRVNGGYNGLQHRIELTGEYYGWLSR